MILILYEKCVYVNQSHTRAHTHRSNRFFDHPFQALVQLRNTRKIINRGPNLSCKDGVSTKQQRHDHLWTANSVSRLLVGKMQKDRALCPRALHACFKGHSSPLPPPWQEGSCSSLKSGENVSVSQSVPERNRVQHSAGLRSEGS